MPFIPRWVDIGMNLWLKHVSMERLLFFMDVARAATLGVWISVLGIAWWEAGQYVESVQTLAAQSGVWPADRLGLMDEEIKQLATEIRDDRIRMASVAEIMANLDKRITIIDERQQGVLRRLDKSELFWQSLQEKFLWAVVAQVGVLVIWFFLGHDLKRRMHVQNESFYQRMKVRFPQQPEGVQDDAD